MMKSEHIPETKHVKPNRAQRRHPEQQEEQPHDAALSRDVQADVPQQGPQDVQSDRAKSSGHGKKTADKWNQ